jgi:hypothetical protein
MEFCDACGYSFNITKNVKNKMVGGAEKDALDNIFTKFKAKEKLVAEDLEGLKGSDILGDDRYDSMSVRLQRELMTAIKEHDKKFFDVDAADVEADNKNLQAFFICKQCKFYKPIKPGTVLYTKNFGSVAEDIETTDYSHVVNDCTLSRTRTYICKNPKCTTHDDPETREACLTKDSKGLLIYICTVCKVHWYNATFN